MEFEPIKEREVLTVANLSTIFRGLPGVSGQIVDLGNVDIEAGAGVIGEMSKCIWTNEGKRITISMGAGSLIASLSKEIDPEYQTTRRAK